MKPEYRDCFLPFLRPGERLVIACDYFANTALPSVPAELRAPTTPHAPSAFEERVGGALGTAMNGGWDSAAGRFLVDLANAGGTPRRQAMTDSRLILLVDRNTSWRDTTPRWDFGVAVSRADIARINAHPKAVGGRGRFDVGFTDGSWIALGSAVRTHMEAFVSAWNRGA